MSNNFVFNDLINKCLMYIPKSTIICGDIIKTKNNDFFYSNYINNRYIENIILIEPNLKKEYIFKNCINNSKINIYLYSVVNQKESIEKLNFIFYSDCELNVNFFSNYEKKIQVDFKFISINNINFTSNVLVKSLFHLNIINETLYSNHNLNFLNLNKSVLQLDHLINKYISSDLNINIFSLKTNTIQINLDNNYSNEEEEIFIKQNTKIFKLDNAIKSININPKLNLISKNNFGQHQNFIGKFLDNTYFYLYNKGFNKQEIDILLMKSIIGTYNSNFLSYFLDEYTK